MPHDLGASDGVLLTTGSSTPNKILIGTFTLDHPSIVPFSADNTLFAVK